MLKIKEIKAYPLLAPEPHHKGALRCINLARIESECGLVGWGECISQMRESAKARRDGACAPTPCSARTGKRISRPIGTGEQEWTLEGYRRLIDSGGGDVVQMDPGRIHGITGTLRAIRLVEAANLQVSAHTWSSALNTAASVHLLACTPHSAGMDFKTHESPLQHDMIGNTWVQENGYLTVREEPGLGVEIKEDVVESYLFYLLLDRPFTRLMSPSRIDQVARKARHSSVKEWNL